MISFRFRLLQPHLIPSRHHHHQPITIFHQFIRMTSTQSINKHAHPFDRSQIEGLLIKRFFYAPAFEHYGGQHIISLSLSRNQKPSLIIIFCLSLVSTQVSLVCKSLKVSFQSNTHSSDLSLVGSVTTTVHPVAHFNLIFSTNGVVTLS